MDALKNFAYSLVATAPSPATSGTSLVVTAGQGSYFPATPFDATIWPSGSQPSNTNAEIVRVTAVSTDTFTITRAQYGTTAQSIAVGYQIAQTVDANLLNQLAPLTGATFTGNVTAPALISSGLTGATVASRYVGGTTNGAPASGTFAVGDFIIDQTATIWVCLTAGTPGTWWPLIEAHMVSRSATATAGPNEVTIFTGSTASQTISVIALPVDGATWTIINRSSVPVTAGFGASSMLPLGSTSSVTSLVVPVNGAYSFINYAAGQWYMTASNNLANSVGTLSVTNGGTGTATAPAVGSIPLATSTSVYTPLAIGSNATVLTSNGTTASWVAPGGVTSFTAGTTGLTPNSATTGAVTLAGTLGTGNGGTNLTTFTAANNALYSTSASALTAGTLPVLAGGTGVTTSTGTGSTVLSTNPVITGAYETVSVSSTALSGLTAAALAASTASFYLYTANPTASFTVNLTNVPTTTGQAVTFAFGVINGATAYLPKNITINGTQAGASSTALPLQGATNNSITSYYQTATAWSSADASTLDYYTITCICTGSSAWTMLLALTKF